MMMDEEDDDVTTMSIIVLHRHHRHLDVLKKILPPFDVLTTYIEQHSNIQLEKEWTEWNKKQQQQQQQRRRHDDHHNDAAANNILQRRTFLVATWSCPYESGNRLHRFMNGLLWSILTNRTLLWRYHTSDVCVEYDTYIDDDDSRSDDDSGRGGGRGQEVQNGKIDCERLYGNNTDPYSDCDQILRLAEWVPSYNVWRPRIEQLHTNNNKTNKTDDRFFKIVRYSMEQNGMGNWIRYDKDRCTPWDREDDMDVDSNSPNSDDHQALTSSSSPLFVRPGKQVSLNPGGVLTRYRDDGRPYLNQTSNQQRLHNLTTIPFLRSSLSLSLSSSLMNNNNKNNKSRRQRQHQQQQQQQQDAITYDRSLIYFVYGMMFESLFTIHPSVSLDIDVVDDDDRMTVEEEIDADVDVDTSFSKSKSKSTSRSKLSSSSSSSTKTRLWDFAAVSATTATAQAAATSSSTTSLKSSSKTKATARTYFIHARHPNIGMVHYIWPEHLCLQRMFVTSNNNTDDDDNNDDSDDDNCHIWVMSDSNVTLPLLHDEIQNLTNCSHASQHTMMKQQQRQQQRRRQRTTGTSFSDEHGPFAGRGYWEDVDVAIRARHGMMAFHQARRASGLARTSTAIIRDIIEFRRVLEHIVSNIDWTTLMTTIKSGGGEGEEGGGCNSTTNATTSTAAITTNSIVESMMKLPPIPLFEECLNPWQK
jgi:hypothetical protein